MGDLSVKFQEPTVDGLERGTGTKTLFNPRQLELYEDLGRTPTVGGLTGEQLLYLRNLRDEQQCSFEYFSRDEKGPEERCIEDALEGSDFCEDHGDQVPEPDYDSLNKDREYE